MSISDILTALKGAAGMGECWYLFVIPLVFNILDIITGFTAAVANRTVSSSAMREGLFHKLGFIFLTEAVSILENIAEMSPALANNGFFKIFESVIHSGEKD